MLPTRKTRPKHTWVTVLHTPYPGCDRSSLGILGRVLAAQRACSYGSMWWGGWPSGIGGDGAVLSMIPHMYVGGTMPPGPADCAKVVVHRWKVASGRIGPSQYMANTCVSHRAAGPPG